MDALQAGCHVFIEKPFTTNVQEAADIVSLARGRGLKVGVGHQFRLCPSLIEARRRLAAGEIGAVRMVTADPRPPLVEHPRPRRKQLAIRPRGGRKRHPGRRRRSPDRRASLDDRTEGAGGRRPPDPARPVIDLVTAAAIRLADGTPVALAVSGISPGARFALRTTARTAGCMRPTRLLEKERTDGSAQEIPLPAADQTIDSNFVAALLTGYSLVLSGRGSPRDRATPRGDRPIGATGSSFVSSKRSWNHERRRCCTEFRLR